MSFYDGEGDDMNQIGYKVSNMMLKNTPASDPKSFKTATEKKAKENEGKTASIITLLDEIDTTLYVINDKLTEAPEIMIGSGMRGGVITRDTLIRMTVKQLQEELKSRKIRFKTNERKADLIGKLEQFLLSPENVRDFKPKAEQREMETQTEGAEQREMETQTEGSYSLPRPPSGMPMSDVEETIKVKRQTADYSTDEEDTPPPYSVKSPRKDESQNKTDYYLTSSEEEEYDDDDDDDDDEVETLQPINLYDDDEDEDEEELPSTSNFQPINDEDDDGSSFNPYQQQRRDTPSSRNDLNANIMRLEEQVNRLSRLTKGLNTFINFSNPVEIEKLDNSYKKVGFSSIELEEHLKEIEFIDKKFEGKMNSILNKIDSEYNKIKSALNSYTYTFLEGGMIGGGCCGCNRCEMMGCEMMGGAFDGAYRHSAKKRFY